MTTTKDKIRSFHKASSSDASGLTKERGHTGVVTYSRFIQDLYETELQMPQRLCTVDQMCQDSAVSNSIRFRTDLLVQAMNEGVAKSKGSKASDIAADFINYNLHSMSYGSWLQAVRDSSTYLKYGFSILNIVLEERKTGRYKNSYCLKKLSPRDQKSVYGWVWSDDGRDLLGVVQKPQLLSRRKKGMGEFAQSIAYNSLNSGGYYKDADYPFLSTDEVLLFSYGSTGYNPQGDLLAAGCFSAFVEKKIIEQYELSGLSKDLGGIIVARSPSVLFEQANDPITYPEAAKAKTEFETDIANMHNSKTTFVHLQSDRDDRGHYLYDFELKGVTGGGKSYSTSDIIRAKEASIYQVFNTQALILGQNGGGSNALSKDQMTSFQYAVYRDMQEMADVINKQLIPRLLEANDIELDWHDMPYFEPLNPFKVTYDEAGKFVQRIGSVKKLTTGIYGHMLNDLGVTTDGIDELDYMDKGESRAADGMATAGEGTSTDYEGGDKSVSNNENGGSD